MINKKEREMNTMCFMDYMGFREMVVQEKVEEALAAARRGETSINIDRGDLSDDEVQYFYQEVRRRLNNGNF